MKKNTLYVTDLDGTLLTNEKRISSHSVTILNQLLEEGAAISVASARSPMGASILNLQDVAWRLPMVLMNGVMLYDFSTRQILQSCSLTEKVTTNILEICKAGGKHPFVFHVRDNRLNVAYTSILSEGERIFLHERATVFPEIFQQVKEYPSTGGIYFSMQDTFDVLTPIRNRLNALPEVDSVMYSDSYSEGNWYLEVFSVQAGKDNGVKRLKEHAEAGRVVAFGDNFNDRSMLTAADLGCAVRNGEPEILKMADMVIDSNEEDGVARYIQQDFHGRREANIP